MPLDVRKVIPLKLAGILVLTTRLLAGDQPQSGNEFAPPERFSAEQRGHWAYQPVKRVEPKAVKESSWVRNPIDRFILAEPRRAGFEPCAAGKPGRIDPARHLRPGRPAAFDRRSRGVSGRSTPGRL